MLRRSSKGSRPRYVHAETEEPLTGSVEFVWLATRDDQIDSLGLLTAPHPPGKQIRRGLDCGRRRTAQAEAINPPDLEAIVQKFVEDRFDATVLAKVKAREGRQRTKAKGLVKNI